MKKIGVIVFMIAVIIGVVFANFFAWGKPGGKVFNFSFNFSGEKGSGRIATEVRDLHGFDSVEAGGVFQVEIIANKDFSVEVEADDNLLQFIRTEVSRGRLEISTEKRISSGNPILVRITAPNIERINASGASKISLADVKNSELAIDVSGASKVKVTGETGDLTVESSGASHIDASNLNTVNTAIDASGASNVSVNVSGKLKTDASGASQIRYSGSPKAVIKDLSGASSLSVAM